MSEKMAAPRNTTRRRLERYLTLKRRWYYETPDNGLRSRIVALLRENHPWWDWGHRVMTLVGRNWCGNWSEPKPPDIWYRQGPSKLRRGKARTTWVVVRSYDEYLRQVEQGHQDWKCIQVQDGGWTLAMGYYDSMNFYGLTRSEVPILLRFLVRWALTDWLGIRRWLYFRALRAAVNRKVPFRCQATPPKGTGGYSHWHCSEKKRHAGPHRFNNYTWTDGDHVEYAPVGNEPKVTP